jgi:hypothetical protein
MSDLTVIEKLTRNGCVFEALDPETAKTRAVNAAFDVLVPKLHDWAEVNWAKGHEITVEVSETYADLFDRTAARLRQVFGDVVAGQEVTVIPFNMNDPTIVLSACAASNAVEILLELEPLWMVVFSKGWVFEWRRVGHTTSGYFDG